MRSDPATAGGPGPRSLDGVSSHTNDGASRFWPCNRGGSEPELLRQGYYFGGVAVDSSTEKLFLMLGDYVRVLDLDGSNATLCLQTMCGTYEAGVLVDAKSGNVYSVC